MDRTRAAPLWLVVAAPVLAGCEPSEPPRPRGTGEPVAAGAIAIVHDTGWLYDPAQPEGKGRKFDSSRHSGRPFSFPLGAGRVVPGWDRGVGSMRVRGRRRLLIPASLAVGERGARDVIPPGAALVFDVELIGLEPVSETDQPSGVGDPGA